MFSGLAFETMGAWGPEAKRTCSLLRIKLAERTGDKRGLNFYVNILVLLCREVTPVIQGTFPLARGLDEVFYILKV